MAKVFTEPKTLREVLTCKSKWCQGTLHNWVYKYLDVEKYWYSEKIPTVFEQFHSHCLIGSVDCVTQSPGDLNSVLGTTERYIQEQKIRQKRHKRRIIIMKTIQKLCEQRKLPLRKYYSVEHFNDHPATQWKHIQLLLRHLPKGV